MSRTLNLVDRLLALGRLLHKLGVDQEALRILSRLAQVRELPPAVAQEVQLRLARLQLKRRKYARARRHLAAVLSHQPANAHYHYLMAVAVARDITDREKALDYCRRCVELDPKQPRYLSAFGLLALRQGQEEEGLDALQRAMALAPDNLIVVRRLVKGLCKLNRCDDARVVLRAALFRNPRSRRFRALWRDFQFQQLHMRQEETRRDRAADSTEDGPTVLPFTRPADIRLAPEAQPEIRIDGPTLLPAPHPPRPARRPDQRHAQ